MQQAIMPQGRLPCPAYVTPLSIECLLPVRQELVAEQKAILELTGLEPATF